MKKVLIAGASGYLGRYVASQFKKQGYWIRLLVRNADKLSVPGPHLEPAIREIADEIAIGEVTRPETLAGVCEGIDIVFSSVGITRQKDGLTFHDVDYEGNLNLLRAAKQASTVTRFLFVSVYQASMLRHLAIVNARERFVSELAKSGLSYTVIRPTGFFSDLTALLQMGRRGSIYLIGSGTYRLNPIHGEDLARVCVAAAEEQGRQELSVGGPEVFSHRELAELAKRITGGRAKIIHLPLWAVRGALKLLYPFNRRLHGIMSFFVASMVIDFVAPKTSGHSLERYFEQYMLEKGDVKG